MNILTQIGFGILGILILTGLSWVIGITFRYLIEKTDPDGEWSTNTWWETTTMGIVIQICLYVIGSMVLHISSFLQTL